MVRYKTNPLVRALAPPPISEVQGWVRNRSDSKRNPLLDVSQAVPSYGPARGLLDHLVERLDDPATALYTDISGLPALREAMAEHLSEDYEGTTTPDQIAITSGCNQAFCAVMDAIARPGDEVILTLPWYFNHQMWLQMRGIEVRCARFNPDGEPRCSDIAACMTDATRAIVLVSPNNPTGQEYSPALLDDVFELARRHEAAMIIDETYKDFRSNPGPPHTLVQKSFWHETLIQLFSFSKSLALTGFRVGAIAANADLIGQVEKVLDNVSICPPHPGQIAALYGLRHLDHWRRQKADILRGRVQRLRECFNRGDLEYQLGFSGTYFAYVKHPFGEAAGAHSVARRLAEEFGVLSLPGSMFGPGQDAYLRFAFANIGSDQIPLLVDRLAASQEF
jgi:aspartate/methionine/tyrosine aminotransferase